MQRNHNEIAPIVRTNPTTLLSRGLSISTPLVAVLCLCAGVLKAFNGFEQYGTEWLFHAAYPLLPLCGFFALFAVLMRTHKGVSTVALVGAVLSALMI